MAGATTLQIGGTDGGSALGRALALRGFGSAAPRVVDSGPKLSVRDFAADVRALGDALKELERAGRHSDSYARGRSARAVSRSELGLGGDPAPTVLRSREEVNTGPGQAVDPSAAFDGSSGPLPNFEVGLEVTAGAFLLNANRIDVFADDSILDVLSRINSSGAGVTASWDSDNEQVVLTQNTPGSGGAVLFGPDTSGFVSAVKLDGAALEFGSDNESQVDLDEVSALSDVQNGTFSINGQEFTIDRSTDSLADLTRWINAAGLGVTANYDGAADRFSITAQGSRSVVLDDGSSGLFSALDIAPGVYRGDANGRKVEISNQSGFRRELREFTESLGRVLAGDVEGYAVGAAKVIQGNLVKALERAFDELADKSGAEELRSGLGLDLGPKSGERRWLTVREADLGKTLRRDPAELVDLLFSREREDGRAGLIERLGGALDAAFRQLAGMLPPEEAIGLRLDVSA